MKNLIIANSPKVHLLSLQVTGMDKFVIVLQIRAPNDGWLTKFGFFRDSFLQKVKTNFILNQEGMLMISLKPFEGAMEVTYDRYNGTWECQDLEKQFCDGAIERMFRALGITNHRITTEGHFFMEFLFT